MEGNWNETYFRFNFIVRSGGLFHYDALAVSREKLRSMFGKQTMEALKNWDESPSERQLATIVYVNQHATRNQPATKNIENKLKV